MSQFYNLPGPHYLVRKQKEIALLANYAGLPLDTLLKSEPIKTYEDIIQLKFFLRNEIKKNSQLNSHLGLTNLSNKKTVSWKGFKFRYTYQRSGIKLINRYPVSQIYPGLKLDSHFNSNYDSYAIFTRSGQTAIFVSLLALKTFLGPYHLLSLNNEVYFETRYAVNLLAPPPSDGTNLPQLLFIDSSTESENEGEGETKKISLQLIRKSSFALIDTTCHSLNDRHLSKWISLILGQGIPCLLLRSHVKLDCLGMEYDLLGSIVLLYPKNTDGKKKKFYHRLKKVLFELCQIQGGFAQLHQIYPFYLDPQFHRLNNHRNKLLRNNTQQLADLIDQKIPSLHSYGSSGFPGFKIHRFRHNLFFWIEFDEKLSKGQIAKLGKLLSFSGVPYRLAESFGFDFITISIFPNKVRKMVMRIAFPDIDPTQIELFAHMLVSWMKTIGK